MKKLALLLYIVLIGVITSCNNENKEKTASTSPDSVAKAPSNAVSATPAEPAKPAAPVDVLEITHTVKDFAIWKKAFDADEAIRKSMGLELIVIGRGAENPNTLSIAFSVSDIAKAKAFTADPRLKEVMEKAGVISAPNIHFWHIVRINMESKEKKWVLITHKVKDFDTWLKGYDGEGAATRAANGMVDVVLARSTEDPNLVHIVFDITDMAKAKARLNDPALKKIMMDAGVDGKPTVDFYSTSE